MWSCPGNMPKYYPSLRHITRPEGEGNTSLRPPGGEGNMSLRPG